MSFVTGENLVKRFHVETSVFGRPTRWVHAVDDVSVSIEEGRTLAVVGESGSGKSTLGRLLLRLLEPTSGRVHVGGVDVTAASPDALRRLRRTMQMVFQDPYGALDPRMTVATAVREAFDIHEPSLSVTEKRERVLSLLARVGIRADQADASPSQFSGGQRQRVVIARALAVNPRFIVADEPVSALDVSIQAQIVNLLLDLQAERKLTYLFVSHDLELVEHVTAGRGGHVVVLYLGRIVERGPADSLFTRPLHPYTQALLSSIPGTRRARVVLEGEVPSPLDPPAGCAFHPRCPLAKSLSPEQRSRCVTERPSLHVVGDGEAACHYASGI